MSSFRAVFLVLALGIASPATAADRPNVLIIMADDCTYSDLGIYGGQNAATPHIDRLASQGLTFDQAYLASAMCQPCRAELFTGQYPLRNGCAWNHSASHPDTTSLPHYLGDLGYRVGIAGKVHVKPKQAYPFEQVAGFDASCVRNPTKTCTLTSTQSFITRNAEQPFCLVIALVEPHVPWVMGDASKYPPNEIELPPNVADTDETRADFGKYLAEITYMDSQVGQIIETLDTSGLADETLVLFTSEQGSQFPGNKWTTWNTGVHTALIARWPGQVAEGERTDALVQYADIVPTLVEVCGGTISDKPFDGTSFLSVLDGSKAKHRTYVYASHNNVPEGPPYPIRAISDGEWRYVRNLIPQNVYIEKHLMGYSGNGKLNNRYWSTWMWDSWEDDRTYRLVNRYLHRPNEALYRTAEDPYEMVNLADEREFKAIKNRLSSALDLWMTAQGDPGIPQDTTTALKAAKIGTHMYRPSN